MHPCLGVAKDNASGIVLAGAHQRLQRCVEAEDNTESGKKGAIHSFPTSQVNYGQVGLVTEMPADSLSCKIMNDGI